MKTSYKKYFFLSSVAIFMLAACHSGQKDSSTAADSANQKEISLTDSTDKAQANSSDSSSKAKTKLMESASKFLVESYEAGIFEIQLSQLAKTNALDGDVKILADTLVGSHTTINAKISAIAASANFVLPTAVNADHQKDMQDMAKITGAKFDKKYINTIISAHEKSISSYMDAYKNLPPSDTRSFAAQTMPKIEDHLVEARKVKERIK